MPHVTIIGGGITGLSTAYYLQTDSQDGHTPPIDYTLYESAEEVGGKIATYSEDGFTIEGGPDAFITRKPWALDLCKALKLDDRIIPQNNQGAFCLLKNGKLIPVPSGLLSGIPTSFWPFITSPLLSLAGKFRMLSDYFISPQTHAEDESLAAFILRHFGTEALEVIHGPFMAGIYASDPERLSMQSVYPMMLEIESKYGSLIRGMRAKMKEVNDNSDKKLPMFMSFKDGMGELINRLTAALTGDIRKNESGISIC
jgi:oxygen-dependent protoporphyrinogen oxidase